MLSDRVWVRRDATVKLPGPGGGDSFNASARSTANCSDLFGIDGPTAAFRFQIRNIFIAVAKPDVDLSNDQISDLFGIENVARAERPSADHRQLFQWLHCAGRSSSLLRPKPLPSIENVSAFPTRRLHLGSAVVTESRIGRPSARSRCRAETDGAIGTIRRYRLTPAGQLIITMKGRGGPERSSGTTRRSRWPSAETSK